MGAEFQFRGFGDVTRGDLSSAVQEQCEQDAYESGHGGYSGTWAEHRGHALSYSDKIFASLNDAEDWILDNHSKWEPLIAAKVEEYGWVVGGWCSS